MDRVLCAAGQSGGASAAGGQRPCPLGPLLTICSESAGHTADLGSFLDTCAGEKGGVLVLSPTSTGSPGNAGVSWFPTGALSRQEHGLAS